MTDPGTKSGMVASIDPLINGPTSHEQPLVETLISLLGSNRHYLLNASRELTAAELDFVPPGCRNSIGSLLTHVAAAEVMFQNIAFNGRLFSQQEEEFRQAFAFERNPLVGSGWIPYRDLLLKRHQDTVESLQKQEDRWLATPKTFGGRRSNLHYYWHHFVLDEARHTGQITLMRKHLLPESDFNFDPYALT